MLMEISNLTKAYRIDESKKQSVLNGLSIAMEKGELVAIVGESGSGKSTLLNIMGGLDSDYEGDVKVSGRSLKDFTQKELDDYRKLNIGFVFQSFNLIPTYTALESILTPADMTTMPDRKKKEKARALLEKLGLSALQDKRPAFLSGGEKQRVALARALMNEPDVILADEPTGALDKDNAANIMSLLKNIAADGKLVVVVTHSQAVAEKCDRVVRMEYGVISQDSGARRHEATGAEKGRYSSKKLGYARSLSSACKNIRKNKTRNILVSLGTGIGIFSVVILLFLSKGIGGYVAAQMYARTNPLLIEVTKKSAARTGRLAALAPSEPFTEEDMQLISEISGMAAIEKGSVITGSAAFEAEGINGSLAVLSTVHGSFLPDIKTGEMPGTGEILINQAVAAAAAADDSDLVGKPLTVSIETEGKTLKKTFTISGVIENSGTVSDRFRTAYVTFDDLAGMYAAESPAPVSVIYITADNQSAASGIKSAISILGFADESRDTALDRVISFIETVTAGLTGIAAVSLVVSAIMILVVLFISVVERTKEIGTLRALGARASDIRRVFMMEGALLGLGSGIVGVVLAACISVVANGIASRFIGSGLIAINLTNMLDGLLIGLAISIPASLIPAAKASKLDPVESLRHE